MDYVADHAFGAIAACAAIFGMGVTIWTGAKNREAVQSRMGSRVDEVEERLDKAEPQLSQISSIASQVQRNSDWIKEKSIERKEWDAALMRIDKLEVRGDHLNEAMQAIKDSVTRMSADLSNNATMNTMAQASITKQIADLASAFAKLEAKLDRPRP